MSMLRPRAHSSRYLQFRHHIHHLFSLALIVSLIAADPFSLHAQSLKSPGGYPFNWERVDPFGNDPNEAVPMLNALFTSDTTGLYMSEKGLFRLTGYHDAEGVLRFRSQLIDREASGLLLGGEKNVVVLNSYSTRTLYRSSDNGENWEVIRTFPSYTAGDLYRSLRVGELIDIPHEGGGVTVNLEGDSVGPSRQPYGKGPLGITPSGRIFWFQGQTTFDDLWYYDSADESPLWHHWAHPHMRFDVTAFYVLSDSIMTLSTTRGLFISSDQGKSWFHSDTTSTSLWSIRMIDRYGVLHGLRGRPIENQGDYLYDIVRSADTGASWEVCGTIESAAIQFSPTGVPFTQDGGELSYQTECGGELRRVEVTRPLSRVISVFHNGTAFFASVATGAMYPDVNRAELYRSTDEGVTWDLVLDKMTGEIEYDLFGNLYALQDTVTWYRTSDGNGKLVWRESKVTRLLVTHDQGETWSRYYEGNANSNNGNDLLTLRSSANGTVLLRWTP